MATLAFVVASKADERIEGRWRVVGGAAGEGDGQTGGAADLAVGVANEAVPADSQRVSLIGVFHFVATVSQYLILLRVHIVTLYFYLQRICRLLCWCDSAGADDTAR